MNKTEFKKLMRLQHGFTARTKHGKTIFGWNNIVLAYSVVTVIDNKEYYTIVCNVENECGNIYYPFGETIIKIRKSDNNLEATFTVVDDEGVLRIQQVTSFSVAIFQMLRENMLKISAN